MKLNITIYRLLVFCCFCLVVACALAMRTKHYNHEAARVVEEVGADFVPFTIESAIMYSYSQDVASGRGIPSRDTRLIGMEDIPVNQQFSLGLEYFLGWGYRLKCLFSPPDSKKNVSNYEENSDFTRWARFQIRLWTSLAAGFIFLWLIVVRCPIAFALLGGMLHAVAPAAIARYTGQDLVRGEFCLPVILAVFTCYFWLCARPRAYKYPILGLLVFLAIATWDMCQIVFGIWALTEIVRLVMGARPNAKRRSAWLMVYIGMVFAGVFVPYHQAHHLLLSPTMTVLLPTVIVLYFIGAKPFVKRFVTTVCVVMGLVVCWKLVVSFSGFGGNYGHFGELLKAKLRFLNVKPADPTLLSFDARVLWTPAMHSATFAMTKMFFPGAIYGLPILVLCALPFRGIRKGLRRGLCRSYFPVFMCLVYLFAYVFIVRYHVFAAVFLAVCVPCLGADWWRSSKSIPLRGFLVGFLFLLLFSEAKMSFRLQRNNAAQYIRETAELLRWFRQEKLRNASVLADFTLSPMLMAYCGSRIALQPKYELKRNRDAYEDFIITLYHGDEIAFNKFCVDRGLKFFVFDRGYGPDVPLHIYSPKYFAAAETVGKETPVYRMFKKPDKLSWFYRMEPPKELSKMKRKHTLFRVISPRDRMTSMRYAMIAERAYRNGRRKMAAKIAKQAFLLDPNSEQAYLAYFKIIGKIPRATLRDYAELDGMTE